MYAGRKVMLLKGGGATGCGIDTKVELRKISEKYHFLIDQWHCIYSLEICIKYNIIEYYIWCGFRAISLTKSVTEKEKREISDCLNDTLTNLCGQNFAKTTLPSNTENMSNVGNNEKNSSDINTTDVGGIDTKVELRKISEKYHFLIDQWHCIYSLEICIKYNIIEYYIWCGFRAISRRQYALGHSDQVK
jgi:hypothetical protein